MLLAALATLRAALEGTWSESRRVRRGSANDALDRVRRGSSNDALNRIRGGSATAALFDNYASVCGAKCAVLGDSKVFEEIFSAIGYTSKQSQQGVTIYEGKDGNTRHIVSCHVDNMFEPGCDMGIIYIPTKIMLNEDLLLVKLQQVLQSLQSNEEDHKRSIILLIPSAVVADSNSRKIYENKILTLLQDSWSMIKKEPFQSDDISTEFNIQLCTTAADSHNDIHDSIIKSFDNISNLKPIPSLFTATNINSVSTAAPTRDYCGIELCKEAYKIAIENARNSINSSIEKFKTKKSADSFAAFTTNLIDSSVGQIVQAVEHERNVPNEMVKLVINDVKNDIFRLLLPFYRQFMAFARQDIIQEFNNKAIDDVELTVHIVEDLHRAKNECMQHYTKLLNKLVPSKHNPPSSWSYAYDVNALQQIFDEYIAGREIGAKIDGVLPKNRKPIDISFHYFVNHPFGKDYKQVAHGMGSSDKFKYDEDLANSDDVTVQPVAARQALVNKHNNDNTLSSSAKHRVAKDSEFAREMLMFPLSIKNPDVPLMGGRRQKKSGPPTKDVTREETGPERFVRWDISPMNQVKQDLKEFANSNKSSKKENKKFSIESVQNFIPFLRLTYAHPAINYGKEYAASSNPR